MVNNDLNKYLINQDRALSKITGIGSKKLKSKRKSLTHTERIFIWEHPKKYGRTCNICGDRITKISDLELDHTRAHSKGGTKLALAHKHCNRMKGSGSLGRIQKRLGIKTSKRKIKRKKKLVRRTKRETYSDLFTPSLNWN
ncbi:MAG: HNH endonuclease [Nanoarchaeota archaeon]